MNGRPHLSAAHEQLDEETADLRDAVVSGWLRLTRADLAELLKLKDDALAAQLKVRLAEQI